MTIVFYLRLKDSPFQFSRQIKGVYSLVFDIFFLYFKCDLSVPYAHNLRHNKPGGGLHVSLKKLNGLTRTYFQMLQLDQWSNKFANGLEDQGSIPG